VNEGEEREKTDLFWAGKKSLGLQIRGYRNKNTRNP
jgi:hypothetical protein